MFPTNISPTSATLIQRTATELNNLLNSAKPNLIQAHDAATRLTNELRIVCNGALNTQNPAAAAGNHFNGQPVGYASKVADPAYQYNIQPIGPVDAGAQAAATTNEAATKAVAADQPGPTCGCFGCQGSKAVADPKADMKSFVQGAKFETALQAIEGIREALKLVQGKSLEEMLGLPPNAVIAGFKTTVIKPSST